MASKCTGCALIVLILMLSIQSMSNFAVAYQPTVTTNVPSYVGNTSATMRAILTDDGGQSCKVWFEWGLTASYGNRTANQTKTNGDSFSETITNLTPVTIYHYRAVANNTDGTILGNDTGFITKPNGPTGMAVSFTETYVNLTWLKGYGANKTIVQRKLGAYPEDITDGTTVYNGTGTSFNDTSFPSYTSLYYRAWSYAENSSYWQYSENYTQGQTINANFDLLFPKYLKVGDYIMIWGMIRDIYNNSISGFIASTTVRDTLGTVVIGPVHWNCSSGNYQTAMSTTSIQPGAYDIVVQFTNNTGVTFTISSRLYLATKPGDNIYVNAWIYYTFYDIATGTGLDDNYYKVYISSDANFSAGDRVKGGKIGVIAAEGKSVTTGGRYYIQIRDFNDNIMPFGRYDGSTMTVHDQDTIHNAYADFVVTSPEFYIDLGIYLNQLRIKNMNASTVYIVLRRTDGNAGQVLGRFIPPWEETQVFIPDGLYNLTVYYYDNQNPNNPPYLVTYPWDPLYTHSSLQVYTDLFYWVPGSNLEDVINTVKDDGTWLYYTIFDMNTGTKLTDDFYKVYFSNDTNFDENDRIMGGKYKDSVGQLLHLKVLDYWGNQIYPVNGSYDNITIFQTKTFIDIGIPLNQFLIKNVNNTLVYFRMTNGNFTDQANNTWYNRWIPPQESQQLFVRSGIYNISLEYYAPNNASFIKFENISNFTIDRDLFYIVLGKNARMYFNFFNANEGLGFPFETLKIYVNGVRLPEKFIETYMGDTINTVVKDYYGFELYNSNTTISDPLTYQDFGIPFYSYKFSNYMNDYFVIGLKKTGSPLWWEKIVCPYETIEFLAPIGNYSIRVYNASYFMAEFNDTINASKAFVLRGVNTSAEIAEVLAGQALLTLQLINMSESYNYTNSMLFDVLGLYYYSNSTIQSILDNFRQPHIWQIPTINYTYNDTLAPISRVYATVTMDGSIGVTWHSTDNVPGGVAYVTLSYKVPNASGWKEWQTTNDSGGSIELNKTIEALTNGSVYSFRVLGTDKNGNVETESDANICNVTYETFKPQPATSAWDIVKNALLSWVTLLAIGMIIVFVLIAGLIERKKRAEVKNREVFIREETVGPAEEEEYYGGPQY